MANHLMQHCILGLLSHTTRLLCTHRTEYLEKADVVLLLEAGHLVRAGNAAIGISARETDGSSAIHPLCGWPWAPLCLLRNASRLHRSSRL